MTDNEQLEQPEVEDSSGILEQKPLTFRGAVWCIILFFAIYSWSWWYMLPLLILFPLYGDWILWLQEQKDWQRHKRWEQQKIKENE